MRAACLLLVLISCNALEVKETANPIRKVVTMLQSMQKKVEAEGVKEKELFDKFMCYCKTSGSALGKSIAENEGKVSELPSKVEEAEGQLAQLKEDLKKAQSDRVAAKTAMAEATAIREKEAGAFAKESNELNTNIAAIAKAVAALEKGMEGAFLQTSAAQVLKKLVLSSESMLDVDREDLTAFLSSGGQYAPQSGAITGILKQMGDTMSKSLDDATADENAAIATFDELIASKTKEVNALTASIEEKTQRIGELGVEIVQMKEDLSDAEASLLDDKKFAADLEKNCATKEEEWAVICKTRSEELLALADTIKILNDDDALELFKKTLPGPTASFLQVQVTASALKDRALAVLQKMRLNDSNHRPQVDFIMMAIHGKKFGFDKVLGMIDDMVALLKEEQLDDDNKKEYCAKQFDLADDKKKSLVRTEGQLNAAIEDAKEGITTLTEEIAALGEGIAALDKSVAEATEQRKEENSDYKTLMANDAAAKDIMAFAKNRLNKFYNPKLYTPPPAPVVAEFAEVSLHSQVAPPPPPEAPGAYKKKSEEGGGVIAMIDTLIKELDTEMTEAETEEKLAQANYEDMMADSAEKRSADTKSLTEKEGTKADLEARLTLKSEELKSTLTELMATEKYIGNLHAECDWLLKFFDMRKEARNGEVDSLKKAKAVLSGADFSLVQTGERRFLSK